MTTMYKFLFELHTHKKLFGIILIGDWIEEDFMEKPIPVRKQNPI